MTPKPLTIAEKKWISEVQSLLNSCPSKRLGAYTVGDPMVGFFDRVVRDKWLDADIARSNFDVGSEISQSGADLNASLIFPFPVESRSG